MFFFRLRLVQRPRVTLRLVAASTSAPRIDAARSPTRLLDLLLVGSLSSLTSCSEALREPELSTRSDDAGANRRLAIVLRNYAEAEHATRGAKSVKNPRPI